MKSVAKAKKLQLTVLFKAICGFGTSLLSVFAIKMVSIYLYNSTLVLRNAATKFALVGKRKVLIPLVMLINFIKSPMQIAESVRLIPTFFV